MWSSAGPGCSSYAGNTPRGGALQGGQAPLWAICSPCWVHGNTLWQVLASRFKAGLLQRIEHPGFLLVFGLVFHLAGFPMAGHPFLKRFSYASKRVIEILEALAGKTDIRNLDHCKKKVEDRSRSLPEGQEWYLLNKLFGFDPLKSQK